MPAPMPIPASLPPRPRSLGPKPIEVQPSGISSGLVKVVLVCVILGAFGFALWLGVQKLKAWGNETVNEAITSHPSLRRG